MLEIIKCSMMGALFLFFNCNSINKSITVPSATGLPSATPIVIDKLSRSDADALLIKAIEDADSDNISKLLPMAAKPDSLIAAIENHDAFEVEHLLKQNTNPNTSINWSIHTYGDGTFTLDGFDTPGYLTALGEAISRNQPEIVNLLLQYGADINRCYVSYANKAGENTWISNSGLACALPLGDAEIIKLLVANGASLKNEKDLLFKVDSKEAMEYLINNGVDVDEKSSFNNNETPLLFWICRQNVSSRKIEPVETLLKAGANPNAKNNAGLTAIKMVRQCSGLSLNDKKTFILLLKKYGAKQ